MPYRLIETTTDSDFVRTSVDRMKSIITEAIEERGICILGLSGGSTPRPIYEALGKEPGIDWSKVWIFLTDDRYIRADDPKSNQFLLRSTLLKHATVPESQIIVPDTSLPIDECIAQYDTWIGDLLKKGTPDLITYGMGDDGHIASLFPPLAEPHLKACVIHTTTPSTGSGQADRFDVHDRISVTLPVLKTANHGLFFLKGEVKKRVWEEMMASEEDETRWPAKGVLPRSTVILG
ncbi:MAG: 6-phosphogluconolactonase [Candidatus Peregrinibacteria bacterium]|nr:6-phosphogluconolactonase [Candidatus Peregrinibacteria bacterium]